MATEKKSVVKEARVSEFNGKKSYSATMEDDTSGYYDVKQCGELTKGELVSYTVEVKQNKKGGNYNLLTVTKLSGAAATQGVTTQSDGGITTTELKTDVEPSTRPEWHSKSFMEMKFELRRDVIETLGRCAAAGRIEPKEMVEYFNDFYPAVDLSIDVLSK